MTYVQTFWKEEVRADAKSGYICRCVIALWIRMQFPLQFEPSNMC